MKSFNEKAKKQKSAGLSSNELIECMDEGRDFIKFAQEKNLSLVSEITKNMLFGYKL